MRPAGAVHVVKPLQQLGFGLQAVCFVQAGLSGQADGFDFFRGGRCTDRVAHGAVGFLSAHYAQPVVRGFHGQGHTMFAVVTHRAAAIAVPGVHFALGRQGEFNGQRVRPALAALHFALQSPARIFRGDHHSPHFLTDVEIAPPQHRGGIYKRPQRVRVEPQLIGRRTIEHKNRL